MIYQNVFFHASAVTVATLCLVAAGCGTNKFEQEVRTEEAAIKLANETIVGDYQLISTAELKNLVDGNQDFFLIDAMPAEDSYNTRHITAAVNVLFPKEVLDSWDEDSMNGKSLEDYEDVLRNARITSPCHG